MRACMPAAAGCSCGLSSNDPAVDGDDQGLRSLTPTTISRSFSQGVGCEGGAARLHQRCREGKPSLHVGRARAGASAGRVMPIAPCRSPPALGQYPPFLARSGHGGSTCKVAVCQKRGAGTLF